MIRDIVIIGGGWAGLSAAVRLSEAGMPVSVLEGAPVPGGRARRAEIGDMVVDNGQHLLMGAYHHTLDLLRTIGIEEHRVFLRLPLDLSLRSPSGSEIALSSGLLPAPWHLLLALLGARGLDLKARWRALPGLRRMMQAIDGPDLSVSELLRKANQPPALVHGLWIPLCLATINTPPDEASARLFVAVLRGVFAGRRSDSDLLVPKVHLGEMLPEPAAAWLERQGSELLYGHRVRMIEARDDHFQLHLRGGESLLCRQLVLATAHPDALRLLDGNAKLQDLRLKLQALDTEPICTVYLRYPEQVRLPSPMLGMLDTLGQWVFDRQHTGQPGLMAVVISTSGPHMAMDNGTLARRIEDELASLFPAWPRPDRSWVIRERQAGFRGCVGCDALRPPHQTGQPGLWLAGDYTATGLPATLEGAVMSGLECARHIIQNAALHGRLNVKGNPA